MKRSTTIAALIATGVLFAAAGARAQTNHLCVAAHPGCFVTVQAAVDAAGDGDTVLVGPGTFAGGLTIVKSIVLQGAGSGLTTIRGGGPVLTIGSLEADPASEPTVTVRGVTITGGLGFRGTLVDDQPPTGQGGGILVLPDSEGSGATTLVVENSVISGNTVGPESTIPTGAQCPTGPCPRAWSLGGGIATYGTVTLRNSTVSGNRAGAAGGLASSAKGGGIHVGAGSLTLENSWVTGNTATTAAPNGRFAQGGGLNLDNGTSLTMRNSHVDGNHVTLETTFPLGYPSTGSSANGSGIHADDEVAGTFDSSTVNGNSITATNPAGNVNAFDALRWGAPLQMRNTEVSRNSVLDVALHVGDDTGESAYAGQVLEFAGPATVESSRFTDNPTVIHAVSDTHANNGFAVYADPSAPAVVSNTVVSGNVLTVTSLNGPVTALGGGVANNGALIMRNDRVTGNGITVAAPTGTAQGGGIFNGPFTDDQPVGLMLDHTTVTGNWLTGGPGIALSGGGIFSVGFPLNLDHSQVAGNTPDDCVGC